MPKKTNKTRNIIISRIKEQGFITVAQYMEIALKNYYSSRTVFGVDGDFTTAPEISQMFGEMIAAWFVDLWMKMGEPEAINFIELGSGRGTLIADIMRTISIIAPQFEKEISIHLVENSEPLREMQKSKLKTYNVQWHNNFDEVPEGCCFLIANEFFDAMPIHQFQKQGGHQFEKQGGKWKERVITYNKNRFEFSLSDNDVKGIIPEKFLDAEEGSIFEISPVSTEIVYNISERIKKYGGVGLIIDYGHMESGLGDTLQAVSRHKYSNPLEDVGKKDITAHVDFEVLKNIAKDKIDVSGIFTQGEFLTSLGIQTRAEMLCKNASNKSQIDDINSSLNRLISKTEMGDLFKILVLINREDLTQG